MLARQALYHLRHSTTSPGILKDFRDVLKASG
jgi:hypothetical protein